MRVGDQDRQQVVDWLRRATGEGRLTLDEFAERAGEVYAARTRAELDRVLDDLPPGVGPPTPPTPAPGSAADPGRAGSGGRPRPARPASPGARRRFVAIMGGSSPRGRWRAAERITAFAWWGGVTIDLREALIDTPTLEITAWAIMGGVNVIVPEGIPVELDGFVLMGGANDVTRVGRPIDGAPLVRVRARGLWGGVTALTRPPRRSGGSRGRSARYRARSDERHHRHHGHPHLSVDVPPLPELPSLPGAGAAAGAQALADDLVERILGNQEAVLQRRRERRPSERDDRRAEATAPEDTAATGAGAGSDARPVPDDDAAPAGADPASAAPRGTPVGGTLTMLVTDICGSTEVVERLGDQRWIGVLQAHNALVREQLHRHHGTEVKAQGDGFLATFTSARQAVLAAMDIQRAMADYRRAHPEHQLLLRIGVHTGEVVDDHGDVVGQNVVVAVRIADAAEPGEILVSSLTKDLTDAGGDLVFDRGREPDLKGISRPWRVHAVTWE
jgi:class 3 adenylate cyclase